jgi:hypothetical protein
VLNWDEDSPLLRKNLALVLKEIGQAAEKRETPTVEAARRWQTIVMQGLDVPDSRFIGAFRGEPGIENIQESRRELRRGLSKSGRGAKAL